MYHAGEKRKIYAEHKQHTVCEHARVKHCVHILQYYKRCLKCDVYKHHPQRAARFELFNVFAELISAQRRGGGKEQNTGDRGDQHAGKCDGQQDDGGNYSGFQCGDLSLFACSLNEN